MPKQLRGLLRAILPGAGDMTRRSPINSQDYSIEILKAGFFTISDRPVRHLACPARFERATYALEGRCSIQLSYGQLYAGCI
jgi:hypothetical protein